MSSMKQDILLYDQYGKQTTPSETLKLKGGPVQKKSFGLFGNAWAYPEAGNFRPRFYTLSDTEQGLDSLSRELLVRWSREIFSQLSFVSVASNLKASFAVGNAYIPKYKGNNPKWGEQATAYLVNNFYPSCCTRGYAYDFQTVLHLISYLLDEDGDILHVFTKDENGFPRIQLIPSHRVKSIANGEVIKDGPFKGCIINDGVIYQVDGKCKGFQVVEPQTINQLSSNNPLTTKLDLRNSRLLFDPKFFDKNRGIPAISSAILQALSVQELYSYLQEKIKLESCVGLIEKNQAGEAPLEYGNVLAALNSTVNNMGVYGSANTHAVQVVQGPSIRYVKADGGELTTLKSNSPPTETMDFIRTLETQILATIGVPHQLVYSPEAVSGRIVSGVTETFRSKISERQAVLDRYAKLVCGWAISNAVQLGVLPSNDSEVYSQIFDFTHPHKFDMDEGYTRSQDLKEYESGIKTMGDIVKRSGRTASQVMQEQEKEQIEFYKRVQNVSKETGISVEVVIQGWKENMSVQMAASNNNQDINNSNI